MRKICILTIVLTLIFAGCSRKPRAAQEGGVPLQLADAQPIDGYNTQTWHVTNKRLLVLFGYNFNAPDTVSQLESLLAERYGLDADGGLILPVVYPDDFRHGAKSFVTELSALITEEGRDFSGIVLLGAPENTHKALARVQDEWELNMRYPVVALFPQDDVLGIESTCDFVLDKNQNAKITGDLEPEESDSVYIPEAPSILTDVIDYLIAMRLPPAKDENLQAHFIQMMKNRSIHHYIDPETGLVSINHYVLE